MLTPEQRELRKKHLGASDIPALFGLDPFKMGADVWLSKTANVAEPEVQSEALDMGNAFEAPLLEWAAKELGVQISVEPFRLFSVCEQHPIFSATLDAAIGTMKENIQEAIEAKTTSRSEEWGEPGTDAVPDRVTSRYTHRCFATT
jgi:predicted phage-related endonuclease